MSAHVQADGGWKLCHDLRCRACRVRASRHIQEWRRRNGVGSHHWPVTLPPGVEGLPSFGVVLAESFRAAA